MADPSESTDVPTSVASPSSSSPQDAQPLVSAQPDSTTDATGTPTLTIPVTTSPQTEPVDESEPTPTEQDSATKDADSADQGIQAADDEIPGEEAAPEDNPNEDLVDLNQIPYSGSSTQNPEMARNPSMVEAGTSVPHDFDVVVANVYLPTEQIPDNAPQTVTTAGIESILGLAAGWWSTQTQLNFSFNVTQDNIRSINTTCTSLNSDALAAFGHPLNARPYTDTNRDLLILETRNSCGNYSGIALTVAYPGNVFQGGIFRMWTNGWTGGSGQYDYRASVVAHEFGHTIGLLHSNIRDCAGLSLYGDDTIGLTWNGTFLTNPTGCTLREYADTTTIMAAASTLQGAVTLNALQRWFLGVSRADTPILNPNGPGSPITLGRASIPTSQLPPGAVRGAVVPFTTDDYTLGIGVEYRWPNGVNDSSSGVYITAGMGDTGLQSDVLVPVAGSRGIVTTLQQPLKPGDMAVSADGRVRIEVTSQTNDTAVVQVTIGAQPGVSGGVAIQRNDRTLNALAASTQSTSTTYRWVANGVPIAGATDSSYTPPADAAPNTVYRVEAMMSGDGRGPTTRYSRGIMTDPQTFTMDGDTARFVFVGLNGEPIDCTNGTMGIAVYTASDALVMRDEVTLNGTDTLGVCEATLSLSLTGVFNVVATFPDRGPRAPIDWLSPFWSPATAQWVRVVPGTTASLFVGRGDYVANAATPTLVAGVDQEPLRMTVSVGDADGKPVPELPVTFNVPPELTVSPATATTDEHGFASATLVWNTNSDIHVPENSEVLHVSATIGGISEVAGSPAPVLLRGNSSSGRLEGVFENGETSATADGADSVKLYVRAWDDGTLVENQPDRIRVEFSAADGTGTSPNISAPVWDQDELHYVVTITSDTPVEGGVIIVILTDGQETELQLDPVLTFLPGDPAAFVGTSTKVFAVPDEGCANGTRQVADVYVTLKDEYGNWVIKDGAGVNFSIPTGSPLKFVTNTSGLVLAPDSHGQYHIDVTSAVPGTFDVNATLRGTLLNSPLSPVSIPVTFGNNSVNTEASNVTVTDGTKLADGTQTHTVTAKLVSTCGVPMTNLAADGKALTLTTSPAAGITASQLVEDSAHPGTYTATLTSTQAGTYGVAVNLTENANTLSNPSSTAVTTLVSPATLSVQFVAVPPPPPNAATPIVEPTNGSLIYGTAEPGVSIRVRNYDNGVLVPGCGDILVGQDRTFSCTVSPRLPGGIRLGVTATGISGIASDAALITVVAPYATVFASSVTTGSTQVVTGYNFNPGESVTAVVGDNLRTLGPAIAGVDGMVSFPSFTIGSDFSHDAYTIVLTGETTGDVTISFNVLTMPPTPLVNQTNGTRITGTAEPGLIVRATVNGTSVPGCDSVSVAANGSFTCTPNPRLADGTSLSVVTIDTTGVASSPAPMQVHAAYATVTAPSVTVGSTQQFIGHNFNPGESVTASVEGTPYSLGPVTADSDGTATFTQFTIGNDAVPGVRTVDVTGTISGTFYATFTVTASPTASTSSTSTPSSTTSSPTGATSSATSPTSSATGPTINPTETASNPTSSVSPTSSTSSARPTSTTTSPTSSARPTSTTTSPTSSTAPTSTTTSATSAPSSTTSSSTSSASSTSGSTSPAATTSSSTSGTTLPSSTVSSSTAPTSTTSRPTSSSTGSSVPTAPTTSPSKTVPTGPSTTANPTYKPTGLPTSAAPAVPPSGTTVATGGQAENRTSSLAFLAVLITLGGALLARTCRVR